MPITRVDFWMRCRAEDFCFEDRHAVISITDPRQAPAIIRGAGSLLRLEFLDINDPIDHPKFSMDSLFSECQAITLNTFARQIHAGTAAREVIIHCEGGVSRSAAIALYIECLSGCDFPRLEFADYANKRVVSMLERVAGLVIAIPARQEILSHQIF